MKQKAIELFIEYGLTLVIGLYLNNDMVQAADAPCRDANGLSYESGSHFIPGPGPCTLCICDNGNPINCKEVFCRSMNFTQYRDHESLVNKGCKTFKFGSTCCELICVEDAIDHKPEVDGSSLHLLRSQLFFIIILSFFSIFVFIFHRLRNRKMRVCVVDRPNRPLPEDQRSLGNMRYMERGDIPNSLPVDDLPCNGGYPLWKPPSSYFPRGEAPPPYEEAVAAARAEQALLSVNSHPINSINFSPNSYLTPQHAHNTIYSSIPNILPPNTLSMSLSTLTTHNINSSPIISVSNRPLSSPAVHSNCYQINQGGLVSSLNYCPASCNYSTASNMYENLPIPVNRTNLSKSSSSINSQRSLLQNNQILVPNPQTRCLNNINYQQHTTLPRQSGAFTISATLPTSNTVHRSIPNTSSNSGSLRLRREYSVHQSTLPLFSTPVVHLKKSDVNSISNPTPKAANSLTIIPTTTNPPTQFSNDEQTKKFHIKSRSTGASPSSSSQVADPKVADISKNSFNFKPPLASANEVNEEGSFDSVTCTCNTAPPIHDDTDDYRSECENCKSATGPHYYSDNEEMAPSPRETMTLQRRHEEAVSTATPKYYKTSLTLPTSTRQRSSNIGRGKWLSTLPVSSTESSDGE